MMKQGFLLLSLLCLIFSAFTVHAQMQFTGKVTDETSGEKVVGASVVLEGTNRGTITDLEGVFELNDLSEGEYVVKVSYVGYVTYRQSINLKENQTLDIPLSTDNRVLDDVLITATRAKDNSGTTFTNVSKGEIDRLNLGQDFGYVIRQTPSLVVTSDAGAGVGYTGVRIRGTDPTRVNVTINGIPLNDSESHGTFWVNLPDFAASTDNIQIQRGVGTSTNGAGAFGGSLNIQTTSLRDEAYGRIDNYIGSFNTVKNSVSFGSGLLNNHFTIDGRLSNIQSDGYVDRAYSDLKSFFVSAAYYGKHNILRANVFSGREKTYQSWWGLAEELLETNRTDNYYTYDNEIDNYGQDHVQLHYSHRLVGDALQITGALHYTNGAGYFEQFKDGEDLTDYGLTPSNLITINEGDTTIIDAFDLIRRKWLDNDFYGLTFSANYRQGIGNYTLGGAWNKYNGAHFGEVIWAQYMADGNIRHRYYDNTGIKTDGNIFLKGDLNFGDKLTVFGDLQFRTINYNISGVDEDFGAIEQDYQYNFFNPKLGLTYYLSDNAHIYLSESIAHREPTRSNLIDNPVTPTAERLYDTELGYRQRGERFQLGVNAYYMYYKDQLVSTGNLNDVGSPIQQNVPQSYRLGIELEGGSQLTKGLRWDANLTLSSNKIKEFTQTTSIFGYDWSYFGDTTLTYQNTDISFSPSIVGAASFYYSPINGLEIALLNKYVGKQYLDNTSSEERTLDPYFKSDLKLSYLWRTKLIKEIEFSLLVNNVWNSLYESNGYTYFIPFAEDANSVPVLENYNFYYPQAGINLLGGVSLRF